ncbi:MAG: hypothetical protein KDI75_00735 [Xanthomonadales bacterium]|nr:hypothetical protein [Xanthomonadales bacterium]
MANAWPFLALILFLPWFLVLGGVYLLALRRRRPGVGIDLLVLLVATGVSIAAMLWGFDSADRQYGSMWPQVFATLMAYGAFLAVLALALPLRWLGSSRPG